MNPSTVDALDNAHQTNAMQTPGITGQWQGPWCDHGRGNIVKVAAFQAPLLPSGSMAALDLIRSRVELCEAQGAQILCCPEAVLGGLADYSQDPTRFAIDTDAGHLDSLLAPIASDVVTSIIGFTELGKQGKLYNSAAVFHRGSVVGIYRKLYPAINASVYDAGSQIPIFEVDGLTFGIVICNDSNYLEPVRLMAARGATALFVPTNNGLPHHRAHAGLAAEATSVDIARAIENTLWVIRADVEGSNDELTSYASTGMIGPNGKVLLTPQSAHDDLLIMDIPVTPPVRRRGWDVGRNADVMNQYVAHVTESVNKRSEDSG